MADPAWKRMGYQSEAEYKAYREVHDAMVKAGASRPVPDILKYGEDVPASDLKRILAEQPPPPASSTPAIPVGASDRRGVETQLDEQLVKTLESQPASDLPMAYIFLVVGFMALGIALAHFLPDPERTWNGRIPQTSFIYLFTAGATSVCLSLLALMELL